MTRFFSGGAVGRRAGHGECLAACLRRHYLEDIAPAYRHHYALYVMVAVGPALYYAQAYVYLCVRENYHFTNTRYAPGARVFGSTAGAPVK